MRKYLLLTFAFIGSYTIAQNGQIPNGGLENWSTDTVSSSIDNWVTSDQQWPGLGTISRSTDATDQNYSIYMETVLAGQDTAFGYAVYGGIGQNGPDQHVAYSDQIDSITFWMKYDMGVDDSVTILVSRVQNGLPNPVMELFKLAGTQTNWTRYAFPLTSMAQDSILIGFASGNALSDYSAPGSYIYVDDVKLTSASGTPSNIQNYSFENWTFNTMEEPVDLFTLNAYLIGQPTLPVNKTTDANSGTYAATVQTLQIGNDTIQGFLLNAPLIPGQQPQAVPYTAEPTAFEGAYKYSPSNGDQAVITCAFYDGGVIVDQPFLPVTGSVGTYTTFNIPINLSAAPDSMVLVISSGDNPGSMIWIDDLALTGGNVGYQDLLGLEEIHIYPNPASDFSQVKIESNSATDATLEILSIGGKLVRSRSLALSAGSNIYDLDIDGLDNGAYIVRILSDEHQVNRTLIIQ